jgi:branched-chain amino acid transport system permease protein
MKRRSQIWRWIGLVIGIVVFIYLLRYPGSHDRPAVTLMAQAMYFGIAAMGLNLLTGYNGQVSIGHGAFFGLGAFTSALLIRDYEWQFLWTLPVAAALCLAVGVAVGFPALRVKGLYLALVTLGLAVVFPDLVRKYVETGGSNLVRLRNKQLAPPSWWPDQHSARHEFAFYTTLFLGLVLLLIAFLIVRSRFGRSLIAVRDHEAAAATVGINPARAKLGAFGVSAMYAGVAGSLSVLVIGQAESNKASTFELSILFLVAVVIGGTATVSGPLIGGFLVVFVRDWIGNFVGSPSGLESFFRGKQVLAPAVFGVTLILFMYVLPDGILGGLRRLYNRIWNAAEKPRSPAPPSASPVESASH